MKLRTQVALAAICVAVSACGADASLSDGDQTDPTVREAEASGEPGEPEARSVETKATILNTFTTGNESITISKFETVDGAQVIMMREEGPAYQVPLVEKLLLENGHLTMLEQVYALAPQVVPHEELVAHHAKEAKLFGRPDHAIRYVQFEPNAAIEKISTSVCNSHAYPSMGGTWTLKGKVNSADGQTSACLDNNCSTMTALYTVSRICNDSNVTILERNKFDFNSTSPWNFTAWGNVAVGTSVGWHMSAGTSRRYAAEGNSAAGKFYHARSGALD